MIHLIPPKNNRRFGTVGKPLAYHNLTIVDAAGNELPRGEVGEIELGGFDSNLYRYLDEAGEEKIHARDRLRTGDLGIMDEDGYVTVTGRAKDLIIRGGVNISPTEIDNVLLQIENAVAAEARPLFFLQHRVRPPLAKSAQPQLALAR